MKQKNIITLNFPFNNGGQEVGINEGGIEHFTGKTVESLCKEILQNSLDAKVKDNKVIVKFTLLELQNNEIPDIDNLKKTINRCRTYWKGDNNAEKILTKSLDALQGKTIKLLKISDFGTSGLTGSKEARNTHFSNLVKSSGASYKGGTSGGSFGIGKFAPFACSAPRTIFYSTLDKDNNYAFQGVSRLVTHERDGQTTQGVGYIGNSEGNKPITKKEEIPNIFLRKEIGTDINILGFNENENWKESIIRASLNSFFESIHSGKLEVQVQDEIINATNFFEIGEKYLKNKEDNNYTYEYFKCLTSNESKNKKIYKEDFIYKNTNYGEIELHLHKEKKNSKKIAYLRSTGMKIIDKGNFKTTLNFSGILKMNGEGINEFIKSLETPSHDKLEIKRHDEPLKAKKIIDSLNKFIREKIIEFSGIKNSEQIDVKGLSKYLPDRSKENEILNYSIKNGNIKRISQEKYEKNKDSRDELEELKKIISSEKFDETDPTISIPSHLKEIATGKKRVSHKEECIEKNIKPSLGKATNENENYYSKNKLIQLKNKKALINDRNGKKYKVILESIDDCQVLVQLKAKYEDGGGEIVEIVKSYDSCNKQLILNQEKKVLVQLKAHEKKIIFVELVENIYSSMEVLVNEK